MTEQKQSNIFVPFLLVIVALSGIGGGFFLAEPFKSSRPKELPVRTLSPSGAPEGVPARMWQDPFTAVRRYLRDQAPDENNNCAQEKNYPKWPQSIRQEKRNQLLIMPVMVYSDPYSENVEDRRRRRYAVLSGLANHDYLPNDAQNIGYFRFSTPTNDASSSKGASFIVPYEWLEHNTVHNDHNEPNSSHSEKVIPPLLLLWLDEQKFGHKPLANIHKLLKKIIKDIKHQLIHTPESSGQIRICMSHIHEVDPLDVTVTVIGPAGSTLLSKMVTEADSLGDEVEAKVEGCCPQPENGNDIASNFEEWEFSFFSPTATASAKLLFSSVEEKKRAISSHQKKQCEHIPKCQVTYDGDNQFTSLFHIEEIFKNINIQFFRTITPDKTLLRTLVENEFNNRNITISNQNIVALISEWDTFYGRAFSEDFTKVVKEECQKNNSNVCGKGYDKSMYRYFYMRGLDGEFFPATGNDAANEARIDSSKNGITEENNVDNLERAIGVSRFDYLRRLSQKIQNDMAQESKEVAAIGVLGSDFYDKLLILQALRANFPDTLFFTTDLDARYLHPAEFKWTRNLIVLSGYGLSLNKTDLRLFPNSKNNSNDNDQPRHLPSFRDNYQTAMFAATQLAIARSLQFFPGHKLENCKFSFSELCISETGEGSISTVSDSFLRNRLATNLTSKVFEVGRSRFVELGGKPLSLPELWKSLENQGVVSIFILRVITESGV